MYIIIKLLRF